MYELKQKYNALLKRYNKAVKYMENPSIPFSERMKHEDSFKSLVKELNTTLEIINADGEEITEKNILEGFEL